MNIARVSAIFLLHVPLQFFVIAVKEVCIDVKYNYYNVYMYYTCTCIQCTSSLILNTVYIFAVQFSIQEYIIHNSQ